MRSDAEPVFIVIPGLEVYNGLTIVAIGNFAAGDQVTELERSTWAPSAKFPMATMVKHLKENGIAGGPFPSQP